MLFVTFSFFLIQQAFSQEEAYQIFEMKLAVKSKDGKFFNYFLFVGKNSDTFQVIQVTGKFKTEDRSQAEPPMIAMLDFMRGKLINKKLYRNYFPYLKKKYKAYFNKTTLVYS